MSLVNDMLNDLDERRSQQPGPKINLEWMRAQKTPVAEKRFLPYVIIIFILTLLAFAYVTWKYQSTAAWQAIEKLEAARPSATPVIIDKATDSQPSNTVKPEHSIPGHQDPKEISPAPSLPTKTLEAIKNPVPKSEQIAALDVPENKNEVAKPQPVAEPNKAIIKTGKAIALNKKPKNTATDALKRLTPVQLDDHTSRQALQLIAKGNLSAAETLLQDFLRRQPLAPRSGEILISLWLSQSAFSMAEDLASQLRAKYPGDIALLVVHARLLLATGRTAAAVEQLMSERPPIESYQAYYELLGLAARQNKQYSLSEQAYSGLLDTDSSKGDWWVGLAIALDAQGSITNARSAYQRALKVGDISPTLQRYARKRLADMAGKPLQN